MRMSRGIIELNKFWSEHKYMIDPILTISFGANKQDKLKGLLIELRSIWKPRNINIPRNSLRNYSTDKKSINNNEGGGDRCARKLVRFEKQPFKYEKSIRILIDIRWII